MARGPAAVAVVALAVALPAGCGGEKVEGPPPAAADRIALTSPAFPPGATIPRRFTCSGDEVSPPLAWRGVPAGTRSLALLMEDPDAPGGTFVHWTVWDLRPGDRAIGAGRTPAGSREGENSSGKDGYEGPCPPEGDEPHRYRFALYALRSPLGLENGAKPDEVRAAIADRAIARGLLTGRFGR